MKIWLNAMKCVDPSKEYAEEIGRQIIDELMRNGERKKEAFDPFRKITIEFRCS